MDLKEKPIYVTQPYLPPLEEFIPYLEKIWENKILTNCGPFHQKFEEELCKYLGVDYICLFTNATIALIVALQALQVKGEVITTPYSFIATAHSLLWNNIKSVFVDVEPNTLNMDPAKIEAAITPDTTAIMPVHCYGYACGVDEIDRLAKKHNLKVIYDAAHAFGVEDEKGSILKYGDLSVLSFHATKAFNTFEGGAIICHDAKTKAYIDHLKNFGHEGESNVVTQGINGKMSEIIAAFGLLQLNYVDQAIEKRKAIDSLYRKLLKNVEGIRCLEGYEKKHNYSYFPIIIEENFPITRDILLSKLKESNIHPRRYFYPLISEFPMYRTLPSANSNTLPCATNASQRILCLPIYPNLEISKVESIVRLIAGH